MVLVNSASTSGCPLLHHQRESIQLVRLLLVMWLSVCQYAC
jgi:hypothetical protein